jgi:hypothetical protein
MTPRRTLVLSPSTLVVQCRRCSPIEESLWEALSDLRDRDG